MRMTYPLATLLLATCAAQPAHAAESITYSYDAKGRLTKVVRTGPAALNVQTNYTHDKANNRKTKVTTGSPNPPQP